MAEAHRILFGTSGWSFEDWNGRVYPETRGRGFDELRYMSEYFDAAELNVTFYRPASPNMAESWVRRTADKPGFLFTAKLHQRFTHERLEPWTAAEAGEFKRGIAVLADAGKFGGLIMQFPWSFKNDAAGRAWLERVVEEFAEFPLFLEVRHNSWHNEDVFKYLDGAGVGFVNIDQPLFKGSLPPTERVTADKGYVRLHGRNFEAWFSQEADRDNRYDYLYNEEELAGWVAKIRDIAAAAGTTFVFNNNHYQGQAAVNSLELKSAIAGKPVVVPPQLLETYPRLKKVAARHEAQGRLIK